MRNCTKACSFGACDCRAIDQNQFMTGIVIESKGNCIFPEGYIELMHLSVYASITGFLQAGTGVQ